MELSSLDIHFLVQEWQELVGARFDKAYQRKRADGKQELALQLHRSGKGKCILRVVLPGLAYLASAKSDFPKIPPSFCMFLRKKLANARVESIAQLGMDRIVIITLTKRAEKYRLILELLAPGNIILLGRKLLKGGVQSEEIILHLLQPQQYKDRTVRGGIPYPPPPPAPDLKTLTDKALVELAGHSGMDQLVKALAIGWSIGGYYAELLCTRAGLDKTKQNYSAADLANAVAAIRVLLDEKPQPRVAGEQVIPFSDEPTHKSFNEALDAACTDAIVEAPKQARKREKGSILQQQQAQLAGFERAAAENQRKGELIYEHYQELQQLLVDISAAKDAPEVLQDLIASTKFVKKYDKKTHTVVVEL